eukprot:15336266-Ditylum_brightwellii.AAC.1
MSCQEDWTFLPPMSTKNYACAAVGVGGDIRGNIGMKGNLYVVGGRDESNNTLSSIEVFNTVARKWTFVPPMPPKRFCCAAVGMGGNIYVIGGSNALNNCVSSIAFSIQQKENGPSFLPCLPIIMAVLQWGWERTYT